MAAKYQALSADHLEHASEASIKAMATADTVAVLLPGAFYFLNADKKPPIDSLREHGVTMAIATDCNPGSSPTTSLLMMQSMACHLFSLTPEEALLATTIHAAKALGMADSHGSLAIGKTADIAIWDIEHPVDLVYYFASNPCVGRIVGGKYYD